MWIDTHCHIYDAKAYPNLRREIDFAQSCGVEKLVMIGIDRESSERVVELADQNTELYAVVGHHPNYAATYKPEHLKAYESMLAHPKVLGIGEIGLDFHWDFATLAQQETALRDQLSLALDKDQAVVFHCREAYPELIAWLEREGCPRAVIHCFAGTHEEAARALKMGCYLGVDGPVTYKKADDLRVLIRSMPRERLLIETDAPYLSPVPYRGKPNRPGYVHLVGEFIADLLELTPQELAATTTENAVRLWPKLA